MHDGNNVSLQEESSQHPDTKWSGKGGLSWLGGNREANRDKGPFSSNTARRGSFIAGHGAQGTPHSPTLAYYRGDVDIKGSPEEEEQSQKCNAAQKGGRVGVACTGNPPNMPDSQGKFDLQLFMQRGASVAAFLAPGGFRLFPGSSLGQFLTSRINAHVSRTHHALFMH